jgi:hypothetical protein
VDQGFKHVSRKCKKQQTKGAQPNHRYDACPYIPSNNRYEALESQDEESEDFVEDVSHQNHLEIKYEQPIKAHKNPENSAKGKKAPSGGSASSHGMVSNPDPVDKTPIGVFNAPLDRSVEV